MDKLDKKDISKHMMKLVIKSFEELSIDELYEICRARFEVFVCSQRIYQENDFDYIDKKAYHIFFQEENKIVAYCRVIPKGISYDYVAIGRVLVLQEYRGKGIATELMKKAISFIHDNLKENKIVVSAQIYVKDLYQGVGFKSVSDIYDECEIPHVKMILEL